MTGYNSLLSHHSMVTDDVRNLAYEKAISEFVKPQSVVLDLGAGVGIHGLMASKAGAQKVYLVEPESIVEVGKIAAAASGLENVVIVTSKIEEANISQRVDVIISVFTGNLLFEEDLLPSLFFARERFLKDRGVLIPSRGRLMVAPVRYKEFREKYINCWNDVHGLNYGAVKQAMTNQLYPVKKVEDKLDYQCPPSCIQELDFMTANDASCDGAAVFELCDDAKVDGWLGWFEILVGREWVSTLEGTHWTPMFLPVSETIVSESGGSISLSLKRREFGEWSWITIFGQTRSIQSTFLGRQFAAGTAENLALNRCPTLSAAGRHAKYLLSNWDGSKSIEALARDLVDAFPNEFADIKQAQRLVAELAGRFG